VTQMPFNQAIIFIALLCLLVWAIVIVAVVALRSVM
jgi:hypothetical protein